MEHWISIWSDFFFKIPLPQPKKCQKLKQLNECVFVEAVFVFVSEFNYSKSNLFVSKRAIFTKSVRKFVDFHLVDK